jgi:hypothetical protein
MMYGWGYLFAHGLVTPALVRDELTAAGVVLALIAGLVVGVLVGRADATEEQRIAATVGGATPGSSRRAA